VPCAIDRLVGRVEQQRVAGPGHHAARCDPVRSVDLQSGLRWARTRGTR
jgi:hypothetical protein